jgi:hypothetical protein
MWQVLGLRAEGDKFTVTVPGAIVHGDGPNLWPGRVALWIKPDGVTHFDQMAITRLP